MTCGNAVADLCQESGRGEYARRYGRGTTALHVTPVLTWAFTSGGGIEWRRSETPSLLFEDEASQCYLPIGTVGVLPPLAGGSPEREVATWQQAMQERPDATLVLSEVSEFVAFGQVRCLHGR